jgi:hypothetical protein
VKVEFLYFKSCPGHKQALVNLRAVLKETKLAAELLLINVTLAQAAKVGFQGSPSIRVNGKDIDGRNKGIPMAVVSIRLPGGLLPPRQKNSFKNGCESLRAEQFGQSP